MLPLLLAKPGLQGGHLVFTPDGGSLAAWGSSSVQIFGSAHLNISWVCPGGSRGAELG